MKATKLDKNGNVVEINVCLEFNKEELKSTTLGKLKEGNFFLLHPDDRLTLFQKGKYHRKLRKHYSPAYRIGNSDGIHRNTYGDRYLAMSTEVYTCELLPQKLENLIIKR